MVSRMNKKIQDLTYMKYKQSVISPCVVLALALGNVVTKGDRGGRI